LRVYRANQPGTPTAFTEQDAGHRPSGIGSSAIALDGSDPIHPDTIHVLWNDLSGMVNYRTFSTATNLWSATTPIATTNWTDFSQGDEGVALAVDSNGMPHAVWSAKGSDLKLHVWYGNKGSSWSAQPVDDIPLTGNRRTLHPTIAFRANNDLVVSWLEGTFNYIPDGIIHVRTRSSAGMWVATETINDAAMTTIDNGPSLLVTPDGRTHLTFVNTNDEIRYWYYNPVDGWHGDLQPPTQVTHDPSLGPDGNGGVYIYGHGAPPANEGIQGTGKNLYFFHKAAGGAWEPWTHYVMGSFDSSVSTRWAQFFHYFPQTIDIAYWGDSPPPILLYIGTDASAQPPPPPPLPPPQDGPTPMGVPPSVLPPRQPAPSVQGIPNPLPAPR